MRRAESPLRGGASLDGHAAWRGLVELVNSNDLTHAASIAYYALLSLFPFLLLVISLLGSVTAERRSAPRGAHLCVPLLPDTPATSSRRSSMHSARRAIQVGVAGGLALIWSSLGVFGAITSAVNEAWGVEKQRSFLKHRMVSFLMLVAAGLVMIVGLLLVTAIQVAEASWFGVMLLRFQWLQALQTLTFRYAATIILIFGVGLVFYFIPNAKTRFRDVWVGAVLTGRALASRLRRLLLVHRTQLAAHDDSGVDCRRRGLPAVDLCVVRYPHVRR